MNREKRNCQNCKQSFTIEPADFDFYKKIDVPPPTFCPACRLQRRLAWRGERSFHKRSCDLCKKQIIAMYPAGSSFPVYCRECWFSDNWDEFGYGREYDFKKPFFTQFLDLLNVVPQISLQVDNSPQSEFVNQVSNCKNCYMVISGSNNEDCLHTHRTMKSKNVADSLIVLLGENQYESIECLESSDLIYSQECSSSLDLSFCYDVRGSNNCFMSANVRNGSYYFYDRPLTKAGYAEKMKAIDIGSYRNFEKYINEFEELKKNSLHKYANIQKAENVSGHAISNAKNCRECFGVGDVENGGYYLFVNDIKDGRDLNNGCCTGELCYEVNTVGVHSYNIKLSADAWPALTNATYTVSCRQGADSLFGCISMRKKQYCILNRQYTKEEYENLIPRIIDHMDKMPYVGKKGRVYKYGEFFPVEISVLAYNESNAQDYFPLSKEVIQGEGYGWLDPKERNYAVTLHNKDIPDHIKDVKDSIVSEIIECAHGGSCTDNCTTAFRIVPQELAFYRRFNLPLPRLCPNCRHYGRIKRRNPLKLWHRQCMCDKTNHTHSSRCPNVFETSYAPDRKETVYCESCYNTEIA
jgi:hypothetical protein